VFGTAAVTLVRALSVLRCLFAHTCACGFKVPGLPTCRDAAPLLDAGSLISDKVTGNTFVNKVRGQGTRYKRGVNQTREGPL